MKVTTVADRAQEVLAALSNVIVGKGEVSKVSTITVVEDLLSQVPTRKAETE